MSANKIVPVDYCRVFQLMLVGILLLWITPMLLGKYADISYPYIPAADIAKEVLTISDFDGKNLQVNNFVKNNQEKSSVGATTQEKKLSGEVNSSKDVQSGDDKVPELPACPEQQLHLDPPQLTLEAGVAHRWTKSYVKFFAKMLKIQPGGYWRPHNCSPTMAATIIVGHRNRTEQLQHFLLHMHRFLTRQLIAYRIIIVEQNNQLPYNRGKLFNIGFAESRKLAPGPERECVILHDVDLLPLHPGNLYACSRQPRHMSVAIDIFRFQLPYRKLCGGALALQASQYAEVNGFSNAFAGWGGEDDDFCARLKQKNFEVARFDPLIALYTMLQHPPSVPTAGRFQTMRETPATDGLATLRYTLAQDPPMHHPLMLHVMATW